MQEGFWALDEKGEEIFLAYDDIDPELLGKLWQPIGGFCYSANSFLQLPLPEVPFYIKDWLPKQGRALFYGSSKAGKSFLTYQMARCIGAGVPFLEMPTTQGRVLLLQFEIGASILQDRLKSTGQDYENVYLGTSFSVKLDTKAGREVVVKALEAVEPDVVILDPLYKVLSGDEDESVDMIKIFDFIDEMIEAFNCSFVIMHHMGKDTGRGARGTTTLQDYPDACIEVKDVPCKEGKKIKVIPKLLRHAELPPEPLTAMLKNFEFELTEGEPTVKIKVREFIKIRKTAEAKDIMAAELGSRKGVYDALHKLVNEGMVMKVGRGVYQNIGGE